MLNQFVPQTGTSTNHRKSQQGESTGSSSSSGARITQEALEENNKRLNPFGVSAAHHRIGSIIGRKEEVPVKVAPGGPTQMELRGVPMKNAPNEPSKSQSASSSSGGQTNRKAPPPVPPGYLLGYFPGGPPSKQSKGAVNGSMPSSSFRPVTIQVKPAPPIFWDSAAKLMIRMMDDARTSQFVLEESAEPGQTG